MSTPLLQESETFSEARLCVPVTLNGRPHKARWTAVLLLCISRGFHAVACSAPRPLSSKPPDFVHGEHASAAAHVSQPSLMLPPAAVGDTSDLAETRTFAIDMLRQGRLKALAPPTKPMTVCSCSNVVGVCRLCGGKARRQMCRAKATTAGRPALGFGCLKVLAACMPRVRESTPNPDQDIVIGLCDSIPRTRLRMPCNARCTHAGSHHE